MAVNTIEVPLGPNASFDGGPFFNFSADGIDGETDPHEGVLVGTNESGMTARFTVEQIQDIIEDEMSEQEPVYINTGDNDDPETNVGTLSVPLYRGYTVSVHTLAGGQWAFGPLNQDTKWGRQHVERYVRTFGATID